MVFEQESTCGYHSTGRSAALFTECYGDPIVRRLAMASRLEQPPTGFTDDPILHPRPVMFIGTTQQGSALTEALPGYRAMVPGVHAVDAAGGDCPLSDSRSGCDRRRNRSNRMQGTSTSTSSISGFNAESVNAVGGSSRHRASLRSLSQGRRVGHRESDGSERFDVVMNAAGAWCDTVGRMAGSQLIGLVPKRRTAFTFAPPADTAHDTWPMVIDIEEQFYFRPEGPQVLAPPCDETPMEPHDVRHEEIDVALGISKIEAVTTINIRSVVHAWAGLRSFVTDHRPVNGWDPDLDGFYWLAGQGGIRGSRPRPPWLASPQR